MLHGGIGLYGIVRAAFVLFWYPCTTNYAVGCAVSCGGVALFLGGWAVRGGSLGGGAGVPGRGACLGAGRLLVGACWGGAVL